MLKDLPILVRDDEGQRWQVGKADATRGGASVYIIFDETKTSRHPDRVLSRSFGEPDLIEQRDEMRVPTVESAEEQLVTVPIRSDMTQRGTLYEGPRLKDGRYFEFSSTVLKQPGAEFGAILTNATLANTVVENLYGQSAVVSANTCVDSGLGRALVLYVTHPVSGA